MKKNNWFKKGLLIYIAVLLICIAAVDIYVWSKLSDYEKTMTAANGNTDVTGTASVPTNTPLASAETSPTPEPTATTAPTPTPVPEKLVIQIPDGVKISIDGKEQDFSAYEFSEVQSSCFDILYTFSDEYSEYADLEEKVEIPVIKKYEIQVPAGSSVTAADENGQAIELTADTDENGNTRYSCDFLSDTSQYDTISELAFEAMKKYALFCTNDGAASELSPYFPDNSEYLKVISSMDNSWYMKHSGLPTYTEETVLDYVGYSDSLVYIEISMKQTILSSVTGTYVDTVITHPVWFVKLGGSWKIGAIGF
ncbi:MAG: hypothetical protein ACI39R_03800 [Lachnospiraceae bacterium]